VTAARAEPGLGLGRDLDVVAERDGGAELRGELAPERIGALPAGEVAGARDRAGGRVGEARRTDADVREVGRLDAGLPGGRLHRGGHRRGDVGGAAGRRRRYARLPEDGVAGVDDDRLDLRPAEVDAAAQAGRALPRRG